MTGTSVLGIQEKAENVDSSSTGYVTARLTIRPPLIIMLERTRNRERWSRFTRQDRGSRAGRPCKDRLRRMFAHRFADSGIPGPARVRAARWGTRPEEPGPM
jgi:hypothetical protein